MLESYLEKKIHIFVRENGGLCIKQPSSFYKGIPDRLIITKQGEIFFVELKTEKGVLSEMQKKWIKKLKNVNVNVYVIRSLEEFRQIYKENENGII